MFCLTAGRCLHDRELCSPAKGPVACTYCQTEQICAGNRLHFVITATFDQL
jgi:hypothetical protein